MTHFEFTCIVNSGLWQVARCIKTVAAYSCARNLYQMIFLAKIYEMCVLRVYFIGGLVIHSNSEMWKPDVIGALKSLISPGEDNAARCESWRMCFIFRSALYLDRGIYTCKTFRRHIYKQRTQIRSSLRRWKSCSVI